MGLRDLSEAIILQSAADLLSTPNEEETLEFFSGEGFRMCAEMAKMSHDDKLKFLEMLAESISASKKTKVRSDAMVPQNKKTARKWAEPHKARRGAALARTA